MTDFDIFGFVGTTWLSCYATMYFLRVIKPRFHEIMDLFYEGESVEDNEPSGRVSKNELIV